VSAIGAPLGWLGHATSDTNGRGRVAALRRRMTRLERRLARQLGFVAFAALGLALALVWVRLQVIHTGYDLSTARQLERRLEQEERELRIEISTLTSPRRLEDVARNRLGMGPPAPGQIITPP